MEIGYVLLGALIAGPLCFLLAMLLARRTWRTARRLSARGKGREHLAELGQLAGGLAHEIKNPLSTINVNLKLLSEDLSRREDEDKESARMLRRLQSIREESDRLRGILDDFLHYAGRYELDLAATDLRRLIGELADFFRPQAEGTKVLLRTDLPEREVRSRVDPGLIKQAVLNLLINAVDAMSRDGGEGGPPPGGELLIRLSAQRGRAILEVIDTGPGMPPETAERIFDVYFSTKKQGTGLGLPTTRRIVREHGGTIRVDSEPGKGTRFTIALPMAE